MGAVQWRTERIEGDPHDASRVVGLDEIKLKDDELAWLGAWPRRVGDAEVVYAKSDDICFLPATSRFESESDLERAEQSARDAKASRYSARLRAAIVPSNAPPTSNIVRQRFWFFGSSWDALQLAPDAAIETLLEHADAMKRPASWIAEELLPAGDALAGALAALIGDADSKRRRAGLSALNVLKQRSPSPFVMPESIVAAARERIVLLGTDDGARYLAHVLQAFDPAVERRLQAKA